MGLALAQRCARIERTDTAKGYALTSILGRQHGFFGERFTLDEALAGPEIGDFNCLMTREQQGTWLADFADRHNRRRFFLVWSDGERLRIGASPTLLAMFGPILHIHLNHAAKTVKAFLR